jgi:hypothetical protein
MGTGSGPGGLNSRVFTNSYSGASAAMVFPFKNGGSFAGLSKPQYAYVTYNTLAFNGAGFGSRGGKWLHAHGIKTQFIPPQTQKPGIRWI